MISPRSLSVSFALFLYQHLYLYLDLYTPLNNLLNRTHLCLRLFRVLIGQCTTFWSLRPSYRVKTGFFGTTWESGTGFRFVGPQDYRFLFSFSHRVEVLSLSLLSGRETETRDRSGSRFTYHGWVSLTPVQKEWLKWLRLRSEKPFVGLSVWVYVPKWSILPQRIRSV